MLAPGMLADVVVLDHGPFVWPLAEIVNTPVRATILGGRLAYEANSPT